MMEIVYKRVRVQGGRRVSMFTEGETMLEYPKGKQITAPVGKIFAFNTLNNAEKWSLGTEVWRAEAEDVTRPNFKYFMTYINDISKFVRQFWSRKYEIIRSAIGPRLMLSRNTIPTGTVLCSSIRLIEKVG